MFNSLIVVPTKAFKDLHTIIGDNRINTDALSHINN